LIKHVANVDLPEFTTPLINKTSALFSLTALTIDERLSFQDLLRLKMLFLDSIWIDTYLIPRLISLGIKNCSSASEYF
jgi:hypothetical protein